MPNGTRLRQIAVVIKDPVFIQSKNWPNVHRLGFSCEGTDISWRGETNSRWRHKMESFSALLAIYEGNSPVTSEFPAQRPMTRGFGVFFVLRLNKLLSKQS